MVKAEIKTDAGIYEVNIEGVTDLKEAWKIVEDTLQAYMPFGNDDEELVVIAAGASLKHIRIWDPDKKSAKMVLAPSEDPKDKPMVEGTFKWETRATYLDQKFKISGVGYRAKGVKPVYMPVLINDMPATDALDADKLNQLLMYWRESEGDSPGTYVIHKIPVGLIIAPEDAESFLLEAVGPKATGYTTDNKTATAYSEWRGDE